MTDTNYKLYNYIYNIYIYYIIIRNIQYNYYTYIVIHIYVTKHAIDVKRGHTCTCNMYLIFKCLRSTDHFLVVL